MKCSIASQIGILTVLLAGSTGAAPVLLPHSSYETCLTANLGDVTFRGDNNFATVSRSHNTRKSILPNPRAVVLVANEDEVAKAILCSRAYGFLACARNGKHGWENSGGCTDGTVVDLQNLNTVTVNNDETVTFQGGATNGQVYVALYNSNPRYVTSLGMNSPVGTGGLILGGGRGPLTPLYGLAIDNLLEVELMDYEGNVKIANSAVNTDLFWLARGGGGGVFPGIVLRFTMKVYPLPSQITRFTLSFGRNEAPRVLEAWCRDQASYDRRMFSQILFWGKGQGFNPGITIQGMMFDAQPSDVESVLEQTRRSIGNGNLAGGFSVNQVQDWLQILADESGVSIQDLTNRNKGYGGDDRPDIQAIKSTAMMGYKRFTLQDGQELLNFLDDQRLVNGAHAFAKYQSLYGVAGAALDVPSGATAYGHRGAEYILLFLAQYDANDQNKETLLLDHNTEMVDRMAQLLRAPGRTTVGGWFNYRDNDMPDARGDVEKQLESYFGSNLAEILRIRWEHDPVGVFGVPGLPLPRTSQDPTTPTPGTTPSPATTPVTPTPVVTTPTPVTPTPVTPTPVTPTPVTPAPPSTGTGRFCSGPTYPTTCMDQGNCYTSIQQCQSSGCSLCLDP